MKQTTIGVCGTRMPVLCEKVSRKGITGRKSPSVHVCGTRTVAGTHKCNKCKTDKSLRRKGGKKKGRGG